MEIKSERTVFDVRLIAVGNISVTHHPTLKAVCLCLRPGVLLPRPPNCIPECFSILKQIKYIYIFFLLKYILFPRGFCCPGALCFFAPVLVQLHLCAPALTHTACACI